MDLAPELRCFFLVATRGSVSAAAVALGVPRSTVSRRLARLEAGLQEQLFERTTRHIRLTEAGELALRRVGPILGALDDLIDDIRERSGTPRGVLRVSVPPGLGQEFVAEFLLAFHRRCPEVRLDVFAGSTAPKLADGGVDVALSDDVLSDSPWIRHAVGPADRVAVACPSYLDAHGTPADVSDLSAHRTVAILTGGDTTAWPLRDGGTVAIEPVLRVDDLETSRRAVLAGMGIGVLPIYMVAFDLLQGALRMVLPTAIGNERTLVALFPPGRRHSPKVRAFLEVVDGFAEVLANRRLAGEAPGDPVTVVEP